MLKILLNIVHHNFPEGKSFADLFGKYFLLVTCAIESAHLKWNRYGKL